jgi:hypothetical protein
VERPSVPCPVCGTELTLELLVKNQDGETVTHPTRSAWAAIEEAALLREAADGDRR